MTGVVSIILIIIWGLAVPFILGLLIDRLLADSKTVLAARNFAFGFMLMAAVFQLLAVPMILLHMRFHVLKNTWIAVILCLCVLSVILNFKTFGVKLKNRVSLKKRPEITEVLIWAAAVAVIMIQTALLAGHMHVDTDDARFLAEAMEAVEQDTMLEYHPLTGEFLGGPAGEMYKDITSPYPIFLGLLGELFKMPPAIAAHVVLPILLIPLCYAVYFVIGSFFFDANMKYTGLFLLFLGLIHSFSFESIFAAGYTLLTIIWQGRSAAAMIMLPLLWYVLLRMIREEKLKWIDYLLFAAVMLACAMLSGMGMLLSLLLAFAYVCAQAFLKRSVKPALLMLLCMWPNVIYLVLWKLR
ncbi:MAG TPA: DUF6077 domain-containing protein [Lachnospiraceae bacterium]|nr:DUF6077 domain-containing protein [Lachnospiraceae bacterium]